MIRQMHDEPVSARPVWQRIAETDARSPVGRVHLHARKNSGLSGLELRGYACDLEREHERLAHWARQAHDVQEAVAGQDKVATTPCGRIVPWLAKRRSNSLVPRGALAD
jgi:hypothetical protein